MAAEKPEPQEIVKSSQNSTTRSKPVMQALYALAEATNEPLTKPRLKVYLEALADLEFEGLMRALESLVLTSRWFPKIPEIREAVLGKPLDPKTLEGVECELAWEHVTHYCRKWHPDIEFGTYGQAPPLTSAEHRAMVAVGGPFRIWENMDGGREWPFIRKAFFEAYSRQEKIAQLESGKSKGQLTGEIKMIAEKLKM